MLGGSAGLLVCLLLRAETPGVGDVKGVEGVEAEQSLPRHGDPVKFELGAHTELRTGHELGLSTPATDVQIDPLAAIRLPFGQAGLVLAYDPRLFIVANQAGEGQTLSYLHNARVNLDVPASPRWRFFVNASGSYGDNDFLPLTTALPSTSNPALPPGPVPPPGTVAAPNLNTLPDQRVVRVLGLQGGAGFVHVLSQRLSWLLSGGYGVSGGADVQARGVLPLQRVTEGLTSLTWSASPIETLGLSLSASHTRLSTGPRATVVDLTAIWSRSWDRTWGTDLAAGAGAFHGTGPGRPADDSVLPVGSLGVHHSDGGRGARVTNGFQVIAAPLPDRLNGTVYERLEGGLVNSLVFSERLGFEVLASGAIALSGPQREARLEGRVSYVFAPQLLVTLGGRAAWLGGSDLLGSSGFGWVGVLGISTYVGPPL